MSSRLRNKTKDGELKSSSGEITEEEEAGETLENRVADGQMVQRIKGQGGGRALEGARQVVGEGTGDRETRETLYLEAGGEMGETEAEATLTRDPPGATWTTGGLSVEDGEGETWVEANPTRTGGAPSPTHHQHRYQTAKWHQ